MVDCVWGSNTIAEFEPSYGFRIEGEGIDTSSRDYKRLSVRIRQGERVDPALLPTDFTLIEANKDTGLPPFFYFNYHILSETTAAVFREFDMGNGYLHPIRVFAQNGSEQIGTYYILVPGNAKVALDLDGSENAKIDSIGMFNIPTIPKDDQLAMTRAALDGPDVWHQQRLKGLYMSDALVRRLKEQGLDRCFHLFRVRIV